MTKSIVCAALLAGTLVFGQKPDNTEKNKRDRSDAMLSPMAQSNKPEDLETTRKIRKAIVSDKSFSTYAKNIKIITADGVIHLRGPVKSAEESASIASIATRNAGPNKVENHLEVAPAH